MITRLQTTNTGPLTTMDLSFAPRLNLITGDNGLGKSFILDLIWFSLTRSWPRDLNPSLLSGEMARPTNPYEKALISAEFTGAKQTAKPSFSFDADADIWKFPQGQPASPGIVFYVMADGSFAVWDPMRNSQIGGGEAPTPAYVFNARQVLDGLPGKNGDGGWLCEGLIKDWVSWQDSNLNKERFDLLKGVLKIASPSEAILEPGIPRQVKPADIRRIPTIKMSYGASVPIIHASAGVKRIAALSYLLMWTWFGHTSAAEVRGKEPEGRITFLFDEVESHLHPKWQRQIIPALMQVGRLMPSNAGVKPKIQFVVSTHSPLVMSSVEGYFDQDNDRWLDLDANGGVVEITERPFAAMGNVDNWLTSEAFDLPSTYSIAASKVLDQAQKLLATKGVTKQELEKMTNRLSTVLSDSDPYWINWNAILYKKGIQ